ncbi:MAG: thioredoxin fold domain-containing protein [Alphaproteobacteria bacterium]|nr:thioredoxin fold domain-containing protein [Alphaproteobacteria bacterium]
MKTGRLRAVLAIAGCLSLAGAAPSRAGMLDVPVPPSAQAQGIPTLDMHTFDATLDAETLPVVVEFHADWCTYCRVLQPYVDRLHVLKNGRMDFYNVDADASPEILAAYNVRVLPTMMIFYRGKLISRADGATKPAEMIDWVNSTEQDIRKLPADFGKKTHG